jgi:hypothetical protein
MNTKDLLKEAIADAKAVRETALTQAKLALEEAFTPRLQSMFAARLQEEMDSELNEAEEVDEAEMEMAKQKMDEMPDIESYDDDDNNLDEIDLDEILAELDAEMNDDEELKMNEAKKAEDIDEEAEEDIEDAEEGKEEEEDEEKEVSELSMDELEELIRDIVSQETGNAGAEEEETELEDNFEDELPDTADDEVNLDEILSELLGEEEMNEVKKDKEEEKEKMEEELQLALETVNTLRNELQEVNLLNAKLLYVNKIFKAKNLTESQKLKVVKTFDKATSAKEAKLVFESLSETFASNPEKRQIKESLGFASKAAGVAAKPVIVEGDNFIARMQKLANIK